ncbi:heterokaryon incompatibility protein [Colletotrichum kahawae]|uniref:Heterokaryon incompatibility protein n=1 Tax=Colletotrichum kahawae TaxID=34407 RepID=A0AAD9YE01_COLKA|nr:heterokaryon incompatibility protein [Colletotrichum kahawae]
MFSQEGLRTLNSPTGFRHFNLSEITRAINDGAGCPSCFLIARSIEEKMDAKWPGDTSLTFRNRQAVDKAGNVVCPPFHVLEGFFTPDVDNIVMRVFPYAKKDDPMARLIPRRPFKRDVKTQKVLSKAKQHYEGCKRAHRACKFARDTVLPSRVLDVGTSANPSLRLFINDAEQHGEYLALSYCWGGDQKVLLRRRTLTEMSTQDGIQEDTLQQSVRDAVKVTRMLGFRYLWVDAFCIIQDCKKDQQKEIGRMATIYKNAAITIAAGTAQRAKDGFLKQAGAYLPDERVVVNGATGKGTVYLRSGPYEPKHTLDKRGWVLQEYMLSSRLLIFSEYELLWQCKELELQSVVGGDEALEYLQPLEGLPWTSFKEDNAGLYGHDDGEKLYLWKTVVEQYTRRLLTNADDRLDALRGITRELEVLWEDSNYFGLWEKWFVELLAWYKPKGAGTKEEESQRSDRAPSWSWASLSRQVMYTERFIKKDAKVKGWDTLGTRSPRHVLLHCRMLNADDVGQDEIDEDGDFISGGCDEFPDLHEEAFRDEVKERETQVLFLGVVMRNFRELGIGLVVIHVGNGFYQRVGLAQFEDIIAWEGVEHQEIKLK